MDKVLHKVDIVNLMIEELGTLSKKELTNIIDLFVNLVKREVSEGNKVDISQFGHWTMVERAARKGRNPKTGEELQIPAKNAVKFTVSPAFKKSVN